MFKSYVLQAGDGSGHCKDVCECGAVVSQCRCPNPNKRITVVCRRCEKCKHLDEQEFAGKQIVDAHTDSINLVETPIHPEWKITGPVVKSVDEQLYELDDKFAILQSGLVQIQKALETAKTVQMLLLLREQLRLTSASIDLCVTEYEKLMSLRNLSKGRPQVSIPREML